MTLIVKLIEQQRKPWKPHMVRDPVQEKLLEIIEKKRKTTKPIKAAKLKAGEPAERGNIIDLMSALKESLEGKKPCRKAS